MRLFGFKSMIARGFDGVRDVEVFARRVFRRLPNLWSVGLVLPNGKGEPVFSQPILHPGREPIAHLSLAADPFFLAADDQVYLFFEGIERGSSVGKIYLAVLSQAGEVSFEGLALSTGIHCSFPYVFKDQATQTYGLIPETSAAHEIRLYTSVVPSGPWQLSRTLAHGYPFVDSVMIKNHGRIVLITEISGGSNDRRAVLTSGEDGMFNIDKVLALGSDRSRMAGRIIDLRENAVSKPITLLNQDCSSAYGLSVGLEEFDWDGDRVEASMFRKAGGFTEPDSSRWFSVKTHSADLRLTAQGIFGVFDGKGRPLLASELCNRELVSRFVNLSCTFQSDGIPTRS